VPTQTFGPLAWWLRLTAPTDVRGDASFFERERVRRGHLVGVLLLALLLIEAGAFYQYLIVDDDHPWMVRVLVGALLLTVVAAVLNRRGAVTAAGLMLVVVADLPLAGVPATAIGGRLDILHLGALYLLVGSTLIAASVLAPVSVFVVAAVNSALVLATVRLMPHTVALDQLIASNNAQQAFLGPIIMQVIVALVAYLWAQSVQRALRRADRAELIAELERREVERTYEMEEGVRQLLAVHVQLANGNFQARVPMIRDQLLWQIGSSLNNLIGRLARLAQADYTLHRTQEEARRMAEAIRVAQMGRQPVWPAASGTPLDDVLGALMLGTPRTWTNNHLRMSPVPARSPFAPVRAEAPSADLANYSVESRQPDAAAPPTPDWLRGIWEPGRPDEPSGNGLP
jgi:hypothetical protein